MVAIGGIHIIHTPGDGASNHFKETTCSDIIFSIC